MGNNKDKEEQIPYEDWLEREKPLVKALHAATPQLNLVRTYDPHQRWPLMHICER